MPAAASSASWPWTEDAPKGLALGRLVRASFAMRLLADGTYGSFSLGYIRSHAGKSPTAGLISVMRPGVPKNTSSTRWGTAPKIAPGIGPGLTHEKGPVGMGEDRPPTWDPSDFTTPEVRSASARWPIFLRDEETKGRVPNAATSEEHPALAWDGSSKRGRGNRERKSWGVMEAQARWGTRRLKERQR